MDTTELQAILKREIEAATGYLGDEVAQDRARLMDRYLGEPLGNEISGRSAIQATDVSDVVESIMPDLMQIFTAGTQAVKFEPHGPEDELGAEQANDYINHIFYVQNNGFLLIHDLFKDALVQINGFAKVWADKSTEIKRETFTGLSEEEMVRILSDKDVEAIEHTEREGEDLGAEAPAQPPSVGAPGLEPAAALPGAGLPPPAPPPKVHDLTIKRTVNKTRFKVEALPPEEMLFGRNARTLEDSPILAHRRERTVSSLVADGYDPEALRDIPSGTDIDLTAERTSRNFRQASTPTGSDADEPSRKILVHEAYLKIDFDGDGISEWRKVCAAGPAYKILDNEEADDHPFITLTPVRMPHRVLGIALAELAEDIQLLKTSLWRATLDNFYFINNGRMAISKKVSVEDVLSNRIGAPIQVATDMADVAGHFVPITPNPIGQVTFPLIEYSDTVREVRTGVTRYSQGLDSESLNKTATGINQILGRSQQRVLLIARLFAETGIKDLFRKLLKLVINHSDKEAVIRLRNRWVEIDPRSWNAEMDMSINVGLGHGTQEQRAMMTQMIMQIQEKIVMLQGGVEGPLVGLEEIGNALEQTCAALGFKSSEPFFKRVDENTQMPPPKPDPKTAQAQAELQLQDQKNKGDLALEEKRVMLQHTLELQKMGMENAHETARLHMEAARDFAELNLAREKAAVDAAIKRDTARSHHNQRRFQ